MKKTNVVGTAWYTHYYNYYSLYQGFSIETWKKSRLIGFRIIKLTRNESSI